MNHPKRTQRNLQSVTRGGFAMGAGTLAGGVAGAGAALFLGGFAAAAIAAAAAAIVTLACSRPRNVGVQVFAERVVEELDSFMIGAAETAYFVDSVKKKVEQEVHTTSSLATNSVQSAQTTEQIAVSAQRASQVAADVRSESEKGRAEADSGLGQINNARLDAQAAMERMAALQKKSRRIHGITETISEIAARTNLLSLNAAIEAARAGEHGRGFAVVAGEVRQLAHRTKEATEDIGAMVHEINEEAERAAQSMTALSSKVVEAAQNVERVHSFLNSIERYAHASEAEVHEIARSSREHAGSARLIADALSQIRDSMQRTEAALPQASSSAMLLAERAEVVYKVAAQSSIETAHDDIRQAAISMAMKIGKLFEEAVDSGRITMEALFDRQYRPIPGTNPQKYHTAFDAFTDQALPPLQEALLEAMPNIVYAGAVDNNGYFPTHNLKFSQPLTGDYETDLMHNRTKRIFDDRTGRRCGSSTEQLLLQTYKRDTGEVMHDMSAPIMVNGRHWGGFRIGYRSAAQHVTRSRSK